MKTAIVGILAGLCMIGMTIAQNAEKEIINGTVLQKLDGGVLVECEPDESFVLHKATGIVFVTGNIGPNAEGTHFHDRGRPVGGYKYITVLGVEKTVVKYVVN